MAGGDHAREQVPEAGALERSVRARGGDGGAQLIRDPSGEVIGAVGVTGDTGEMDDLCAIAGIHGTGLKTDEDFKGTEQVHALNIKNDDWPRGV